MKAKQSALQEELLALVHLHLKVLLTLERLEETNLQQQADLGKWSALECVEHLCRYGDFYLPEVRKCIADNPTKANLNFRSSWLGEYFAQSMWPKANFKPMQTFKSMNPHFSETRSSVLQEFRKQLLAWETLLKEAAPYSWRKVKTGISISKFIRIRLGDTLRVVIYHNHRHLQQALRAAGVSDTELANYQKTF